MTSKKKHLAGLSLVVALVMVLSIGAFAQMGAGSSNELQQKLMAMKQAAAANKQTAACSISGWKPAR